MNNCVAVYIKIETCKRRVNTEKGYEKECKI